MKCIVKPGVTRVAGKRVSAGQSVEMDGSALAYEIAQGNVTAAAADQPNEDGQKVRPRGTAQAPQDVGEEQGA